MELSIYNLMYIDPCEKRYLSGKSYSDKERIDLYVKGSCVLDRSLKINGLEGVCILTNNKEELLNSLERIGYKEITVIEIPFTLNVPKGIRFYSAHFKIDVFQYFSTLPTNQYSILLDSDVVCLRDFNKEFYSIVEEGIPTVYYLDNYGGDNKIEDINRITSDIKWLPWAGGEYIGGVSSFYSALYSEIMTIKEDYWRVINGGLFHIGDEMLTSIALSKLRRLGISPVDVKYLGIIHRYWSVTESKHFLKYNSNLIHLPGDKVFESKVDLSASTINELFSGYSFFHLKNRIKQIIKEMLGRK